MIVWIVPVNALTCSQFDVAILNIMWKVLQIHRAIKPGIDALSIADQSFAVDGQLSSFLNGLHHRCTYSVHKVQAWNPEFLDSFLLY